MSSYLSTPYEMSVPQESVNVQLVGTVLNKLQNKYDTNKALIDQTLEKYKSLRGISDADNEYIAARVAQAESAVKNFAQTNGDLSRSSNRDSMMSAMRGVYEDPLVKNAVQQRVKLENYETEVARLKDKNDGRYSDVNYQYGLYKAGLQDYKEGKTKGLGSLNYSNNIDISKTYLEKLETVKKLKGERSVEYLSKDGTTKYTRQIKGMTDSEIRKYVGTLMTAEENHQLKINGWAKFGANEVEAREMYSKYTDLTLEQTEADIQRHTAAKNNKNLSEPEIKLAEDELAQAIETRDNLISRRDKISEIPIDVIGQQLEKANFVNGLSQLASAEWSTSSDANDVYFKSADLEIKYEELQLKKLAEARKSGLNPDGTINTADVLTVSTAEVADVDLGDQKGQESIQKRHDTEYKKVLDIGKDIFSDPNVEKADKNAFEAELKARGLNKDLTRIDPNSNKTQSIAHIIQQAFDASRIGATYADKAKALSSAIIKKENIANDIINVESEAYDKAYNENPDKYILSMMRQENEIRSTYVGKGVGLPIFAAVNQKLGNDVEGKKLLQEIDNFKKEVGGWGNLKSYLDKNPSKIREFAILTDKSDKLFKGLLQPGRLIPFSARDNNLVEDAKAKTEGLYRDKSKSNSLTSFTDYNTINFVNEDVNTKIVSGLAQNKIDGAGFDPKKAITVRLVGENIEMLQHQGEGKAQWNSGSKYQTKAVVSPGDASYNEMMKYIDTKEGESTSLNADQIGVAIPSSRAVRVDKTKNEDKAMNGAYEISRAVQGNPNLVAIFREVGGDPTAYAWDDKIRNTLSVKLADYPKEQVNAFTERYLNELESYVVTPYVTKRFGNKEWAIKIETAKGKPIMEGKSLGLKNLDENTAWLLKYQPQTFITEFLIRELTEDKGQTKINTILDGRD